MGLGLALVVPLNGDSILPSSYTSQHKENALTCGFT